MKRSKNIPPLPIAVSMGEPAGIGTEITLKAYSYILANFPAKSMSFFLIDDPVRVAKFNQQYVSDVEIVTISNPSDVEEAFKTGLPVLPLTDTCLAALEKVQLGQPSTDTALCVLKSMEMAVQFSLEGLSSAIVTNPIQKETLIDAGFEFNGHTEYLGSLCQSTPLPSGIKRGPSMLLAAPDLRVSPVTIHIPLSEVPKALNTESIIECTTILHQALIRDFSISTPRLAICGLNPHAGEGGKIGNEENDIIVPAIHTLRANGINALGPVPADTMFHAEARAQYDGAITMYHDQGLIPIKAMAFHEAVNTTLGLPIVRTSPDHGTGLRLAGKNLARPDSMIQALLLAQQMHTNRFKFDHAHVGKS